MEYSGKDPRECKILFNWGLVVDGRITHIEMVDELSCEASSYTIEVTNDDSKNFLKNKKDIK